MKKLPPSILLVFWAIVTYGQDCSTYTINGDLSQNVSFPTYSVDRAIGFSSLNTDISARYFSNSSAATVNPQPPSGYYINCWIHNYDANETIINREGFKAELGQPIAKGTGQYELTFDMACLATSTYLPHPCQVGIYGIYNPTGALSTVSITGPYTPSNMDLYGATNTIFVSGIEITNNRCDGTKSSQTVIIDSDDNSFPPNGITHFFISDDGIPAADGLSTNRVMGFDNFCVKPVISVPVDTCPTVTALGWLGFLNDLNGDGKIDRSMDVEITGAGTVSFSVDCGTVSPSSVSSPGIYTITILSSASCNLTSFDYVTSYGNGISCNSGQLFYDGNAGCPTANDILFSNEGTNGYCETGYATLLNYTAGAVDWSWTIGSYSGTTSSTGNHTPIYYQAGYWNNQYLVICANPVGGCPEVCKYVLLNCGRDLGDPIGLGDPMERAVVSPNPSNGIFTVTAPEGKKIQKTVVVNNQGNSIKVQGSERLGRIDLNVERQGLYFLKVFYEDGTTENIQLKLQK